jgi:hypothetical protein
MPASAIHCFRLFFTMGRATKPCEATRDVALDLISNRTARGVRSRAGHDVSKLKGLEHFPLALIPRLSLPGLTRQSIFLRRKMDPRVKPAGDACGSAALNQTNRRMLYFFRGISSPALRRAGAGYGE